MLSRLATPVLVVVIGIAAVVLGLTRDDDPSCGEGTEFGPGQVCQIVTKGQTVRQTFEEMHASRQRTNFWIPVTGVLVIIAGLGYGAAVVSVSLKTPTRSPRHRGHPNHPGAIPAIPSLRDVKPVGIPQGGPPPDPGAPRPGPARGSTVPRPGEQPPEYWPSRSSAPGAPDSAAQFPPPQQEQRMAGPPVGMPPSHARPAEPRTGSWQYTGWQHPGLQHPGLQQTGLQQTGPPAPPTTEGPFRPGLWHQGGQDSSAQYDLTQPPPPPTTTRPTDARWGDSSLGQDRPGQPFPQSENTPPRR